MPQGFDEHGYCFVCDHRHATPACIDNYANFFKHMLSFFAFDNPYWRAANHLSWSQADGAD